MRVKEILRLICMVSYTHNILIATPEAAALGMSSMDASTPGHTQNFTQPDQHIFLPEIDRMYLEEIKQLKDITRKKFETIEYIQNNAQFLKGHFPDHTDALNRIEHVEGKIVLEFFPEDPEERVKQYKNVIDQYKKIDEEYSSALGGMESFYKLRQMVKKDKKIFYDAEFNK